MALAGQRAMTVHAIRYRLSFSVPASLSDPVKGEEDLDFEYSDNNSALLLDFKANPAQIGGLVINGQTTTPDLRMEHLVLASGYLKRGPNHLHISFTAGNRPLNRNPEFLYTLLVPDRARELFPCFDQPDLKAVFTLSLTLPAGWRALANAPQVGGGATGDATFAPSDTLSTYLFAFAAGIFKDSIRTNSPMEALYRETDTARVRCSLDSLFRIQGDAIAFLERYTAIPFPFKKFGFVAIPDFQFGGMEHPGAIQYKASALFLDEASTKDQRNARANVLSHETAHMWFGDLVTMRWFNDVWMKEVFANFMADKITSQTAPAGNFNLKFLTDHLPAAYGVDRTQGSNPIRQPLDNLQNAGSLYGNIIYHKAPVMMRQLELQMGAGPFRDGVREYLKTYAYGNATWPDLIRFLGKHTTMDLVAWNKVWVNETGRPVIRYRYSADAHGIKQLTLLQAGEDGSARVWPQVIDLALVYKDHIDTVMVNLKTATTEVTWARGKPRPEYILFNASGLGYGVFPIFGEAPGAVGGAGVGADKRVSALKEPVMRASFFINAYENMLDGKSATPMGLLSRDEAYAAQESDELTLGVLLGQINAIFWHFLSPRQRQVAAKTLETNLWRTMQTARAPGVKKLLFLTYAGIALSRAAEDSVYTIWNTQHPPEGVKLSEDEYAGLAAGLALRKYPGSAGILREQGQRIHNPDRQARWRYLQPSLSADQSVRDSFFFSLKEPKNREKESWVLSALGYLHHPLRTAQDEKYLSYSLDWMEDIQRTGDVFFPQSWAAANLGNYQSATAAALVKKFQKTHAGYNPQLMGKILQAADNLFRAQSLVPRQ
jgi:aminopeptidase N